MPESKIKRMVRHHSGFILLTASALLIILFVIWFSTRPLPEDLYLDALEAQGLGEDDRSKEVCLELIRKFPDWDRISDVHFLLGNLFYFRENNIDQALHHWHRVLIVEPDSVHEFSIHRRLAEIYENVVGDSKRALEHWTILIEKFPDNPDKVIFKLKIIENYIRIDQFETALIELKNLQGVVTDPHLADQIMLKISMIYIFQKNYSQAEETLQGVLQDPHCAQCEGMAMLYLADTLEAQENYGKAIDILSQIPHNILDESIKESRVNYIREKRKDIN